MFINTQYIKQKIPVQVFVLKSFFNIIIDKNTHRQNTITDICYLPVYLRLTFKPAKGLRLNE